jgi:hypothetical protein
LEGAPNTSQHSTPRQPSHLESRIHLDDVDVLQMCMQVHLAQHLVAVELMQAAGVVHLERHVGVALAVDGLQDSSKSSRAGLQDDT